MGRRRPVSPVSDEDAALFRDAVGDARALDDERAPGHRRARDARARPAASGDGSGVSHGAPASERDGAQLFVRPGLQQKHVRRLRRGQMRIEAETDLHGLRAREAQTLLNAFLRECREQHLRCVRVIHGKGRGSHDGRAVLKWEVDGWLRRDDGVMAFCTAQPRDGGTGAVYVLLKR